MLCGRGSRFSLFVLLPALILLILLAPAGIAWALPGWSVLSAPLPQGARPTAAGAFGEAGVVVAGQGGSVAVSTDNGRSWARISPSSLTATTLRGVAFTDARHGVVVGDRTTILVGAPDGTGLFAWSAPILRDDVTADLRGVVLHGTVGYAVGTGGVVLQTVNGGQTWRRESVASGADLNGVAMSADGQIVAAVGDRGTVLVKKEGGWQTAVTSTSADLVDVTVSRDSSDGTVFCCSSGRVFSLPRAGSLRPLAAQPTLPRGVAILALALVESPWKSRLVAGATGGWLAGLVVGGTSWTRQRGGATSTVTALAAAGDGVCYATTADGRMEQTLSAGADVTLALQTTPSVKHEEYRAIITTGASVALSGHTSVLAPGVLLLQSRPAGGTAWRTVASGDPGARTVSDSETPRGTTSYRLRFVFAGTAAATGATVAVGVRHRVSVAATTYRLSRHDIYRVRGSVEPTAPAGRYVEVWTDRSADHRLDRWHRISLGWPVHLADGHAFVTREFGTPVRETYHLRIRMPADRKHLAGWSPRITVIVR